MQPMTGPTPASMPQPAALRQLPLLTLYLTDRCNSRCVSCDYWRSGRTDITLAAVQALLPGLAELATRVVVFSGGEPLLHAQWAAMARLLRAQGLQTWLLSSGLALAKHAALVGELFDSVTISLDGSCRQTYAAIRGVDAFDSVCEGLRSVASLGRPARLRVTLQRANYRELPAFVELARRLQVDQVSFLAADVHNPHAFGRQLPGGFAGDIALRPDDLPLLRALIAGLEHSHQADFESGFIAESPAKLRRIVDYYGALCGLGGFPPVRCNAPEFSAVMEADGRLRPCFFIPGSGVTAGSDLGSALNDAALMQLRADIQAQRRAECGRCVCSMWRDPQQVAAAWAGGR